MKKSLGKQILNFKQISNELKVQYATNKLSSVNAALVDNAIGDLDRVVEHYEDKGYKFYQNDNGVELSKQASKKQKGNIIASYVKSLKEENGSFFGVDLVKHLDNVNSKNIKAYLDKLVKAGKLTRKYRVYNNMDASEYVDFSHKQNIPLGGYVNYPATGGRFYVSKYNPDIDVYYC